MQKLDVSLAERSYPIYIDRGLLGQDLIRGHVRGNQVMVVTNETIAPLYLDAVTRGLGDLQCDTLILPDGEQHKTLATLERIFDALMAHRHSRTTTLVALGGGVIGDMVGFAAACYQRGVDFIQVPTTLLAQVDSSVGGKTAVNHPRGKNMIGAFHQPALVVIDPELLSSLPLRELRCGLAECIKHAVIRDPSLFDWIAGNAARILALEPDALVELVRRNVEIKAAVVVEDERERGVRAHLNFGHTFAHAIEATAGYGEILHGEAVALGMLAATRTAIEAGLCDASLLDDLTAVVEAFGLDTRCGLADSAALDAAMRQDKKVVGGRVRLVVPDRLGHVVIRNDIGPECVRAGWDQIRAA